MVRKRETAQDGVSAWYGSEKERDCTCAWYGVRKRETAQDGVSSWYGCEKERLHRMECVRYGCDRERLRRME